MIQTDPLIQQVKGKCTPDNMMCILLVHLCLFFFYPFSILTLVVAFACNDEAISILSDSVPSARRLPSLMRAAEWRYMGSYISEQSKANKKEKKSTISTFLNIILFIFLLFCLFSLTLFLPISSLITIFTTFLF
jgi:hypothetical protein